MDSLAELDLAETTVTGTGFGAAADFPNPSRNEGARTALGLVGMGFVVARFGLFLRLVRPDVEHASHPWAAAVGVALAVLGAVAAAAAAWQHRRSCRTLGPDERPPQYGAEPALLLGFGVAVAGAALAVVIAM